MGKRGPQPEGDEPRTGRVMVSMTPTRHSRAILAAAAAGVSLSTWLRDAAVARLDAPVGPMSRVEAGGDLEISRSNDGDDHTMRVRVRVPGTGILLELECDARDFLLALTGWAATPCTVTVDLDRLQRAANTTNSREDRS